MLTQLAQVGADPADDDETRLQKALLVLIAILNLPIAATWAVLYLFFGAWTGWVAVVYAVVSLASIALFARTRDFGMLLNTQLLAIVLAPTLSMAPIGGLLPTGGVGVWGIMAPLGALVFRGVGAGVRFVLWLVLFLYSGIAAIVLGTQSPMPAWFSSLMLALNIAVGGTMMFTLLALFAKQRQDALAALRVEQERAESLLLNILPGSIAQRLKGSPRTSIADQINAASVLFADVVDFTPHSANLTAAEVVGQLDRLFSHFDDLAERYGLEKIKTIGDAYMVAAGVPEPRSDHARALALLAERAAVTRPVFELRPSSRAPMATLA